MKKNAIHPVAEVLPMMIDREFCIDCGVCAVTCFQDVIIFEKTINNIPVQSRPGLLVERSSITKQQKITWRKPGFYLKR